MELNRGEFSVQGTLTKAWNFGSSIAPAQTITFLSMQGDCYIKMTPEGDCYLRTVSGNAQTIYVKANTTYKLP